MVTQNPISHASFASPTTPKRVWKPKAATTMEGIPSMFAAASLSRPLKVNTVTSNSVRRKTGSAAAVTTPGTSITEINENTRESLATSDPVKTVTVDVKASPTETRGSSVVVSPPRVSMATKEPRTNVTASPTKSRDDTTTTKSPSKPSASRPVTSGLNKTKLTRTNSSGSSKVMGFGSTSVAGTPQSWPKPHAVPAAEKGQQQQVPKDKKQAIRNQFSNTQKDAVHIAPCTMDDLIPEMYRKKSAAQLAKEQQEEIRLMQKIMWELRRQEQDREERALMAATKPIDGGIQAVMRKLKETKEISDDCDSHASSLDSKKKSKDPYSTHMESKLAYFNSNHSVSLDSNWDDSNSNDSSSVSSWDSDASGDGLFR